MPSEMRVAVGWGERGGEMGQQLQSSALADNDRTPTGGDTALMEWWRLGQGATAWPEQHGVWGSSHPDLPR